MAKAKADRRTVEWMNECFFCGPTDNQLTEEHVWPKWVSRLLLRRYNSDHFQHLRAAGDNTTANWRSRYLDVTTTTVCSECNNNWLSTFENEQIEPLASQLTLLCYFHLYFSGGFRTL